MILLGQKVPLVLPSGILRFGAFAYPAHCLLEACGCIAWILGSPQHRKGCERFMELPFAIALAKLSGSALSSTGYKLKDLLDLKPATVTKVLDSTSLVRSLLIAHDDGTDPLVGYWRLNTWTNPASSSTAGMYVTGGLSIFYRDPLNETYHGILSHLVYNRLGDDNGIEQPYAATYSAKLQMNPEGILGGTSRMLEKHYVSWFREQKYKLDKRFKHLIEVRDGKYSAGRISGDGALKIFTGTFQTTKGDPRTFEFNEHTPWSRMTDLLEFGT